MVDLLNKIKSIRNFILILSGSILGGIIGTSVVKYILSITGEASKTEDDKNIQ